MLFRNKKNFILIFTILIFNLSTFLFSDEKVEKYKSKTVIGVVEDVFVESIFKKIPARIDSGAKYSSINAKIESIEDNFIKFTFIDHEKNEHIFNKKIVDKIKIRNSEGSSERYLVKLKVKLKDKKIDSLFSLKDRENLTYKVLIGRELMYNNFVIDIDEK
jgi:hypothetical protein